MRLSLLLLSESSLLDHHYDHGSDELNESIAKSYLVLHPAAALGNLFTI